LKTAKVTIYTIIVWCFALQFAYSQLEAGFKLGASTVQLANPDLGAIILEDNGFEEYKLEATDINFGYHLGLYSRLTVWKLFLQPEIVLNSNSVNYTLTDLNDPNNTQILKEQYTRVDVPVLLGFKTCISDFSILFCQSFSLLTSLS